MSNTKIFVFIVVLIVVSYIGYNIYSNQVSASSKETTTTTNSVKNGGIGSAFGGLGALFGL